MQDWRNWFGSKNKDRAALAPSTTNPAALILEHCPAHWLRWDEAGLTHSANFAQTLNLDGQVSPKLLVTAFDPTAKIALYNALKLLEQERLPFTLNVTSKNGSLHWHITGQRLADGSNLIWLTDMTVALDAAERANEGMLRAESRKEELYQLADKLPLILWHRDVDTKLRWVNETYAKAVDSTVTGVIAQQIELLTKSNAGKILLDQVKETKTRQSAKHHVIVQGTRRLLEIFEQPLNDGYLGYAVDLTPLEQMEGELKRLVDTYAEVLNRLSSAIAIYDAEQKLIYFNQAYIKLWHADENFLASGPTYGELLEDHRRRRRLPEQVDFQRYKRERQALFTSLLAPQEDLVYLPNGDTIRNLAIPHPHGGLIFVMEDVTDTLALESSYNTLVAVQRETLNNLSQSIVVYGTDGKISLSNPAFTKLWDLPEIFIRAQPHITAVVDQIAPHFAGLENWPELKNQLVSLAFGRESSEGRIIKADGSIIHYSTTPLPDGGVLNSFLDVTDSVRIEQALIETNTALSAADRLKSAFVANVSYQLRTPLNTIMGFAEILTNQYFGELNERQLEYSRTILEASRRLLLLINDILDLATIEAGRMALSYQAIDLVDLCERTIELVQEWADTRKVELVVELAAPIPPFQGDEKRIQQALFNLLSNAIEYTPPGGKVTLAGKADSRTLSLTVTDTGIGIAEADQHRIFNTFERGDNTASQIGAGLGLSLVKSFIELHGGEVELSSTPNYGTTVVCRIPLTPPGSATQHVAA